MLLLVFDYMYELLLDHLLKAQDRIVVFVIHLNSPGASDCKPFYAGLGVSQLTFRQIIMCLRLNTNKKLHRHSEGTTLGHVPEKLQVVVGNQEPIFHK